MCNYSSAAIAKTGVRNRLRPCLRPMNAAGCDAGRSGHSCGSTAAAISSSCARSVRSRTSRDPADAEVGQLELIAAAVLPQL